MYYSVIDYLLTLTTNTNHLYWSFPPQLNFFGNKNTADHHFQTASLIQKQWITFDRWVSMSKNAHPVVKSLTPSFAQRRPQASGSQQDCWVLRTPSHFHTCWTRWSGRRGESAATTLLREQPCVFCVVKLGPGFTQEQPRVALGVAGAPTHPSKRQSGTTALTLSSVSCRWATCWWSFYGSLCSALWLAGRRQRRTSYFNVYFLEVLYIEMSEEVEAVLNKHYVTG